MAAILEAQMSYAVSGNFNPWRMIVYIHEHVYSLEIREYEVERHVIWILEPYWTK